MFYEIFIPKDEVSFENSLSYYEKICSDSGQGDDIVFSPFIEKPSYVHPTAALIGGIYIAKNCFIGPYSVLRMDEENCVNGFFMGEGSNLQDHVVVHSKGNKIGKNCNIAHHAIIHGSCIEDNSTVYIRTTIDHSTIGKNCFIDAKSYIRDVVIPDNSYVPPGTIIDGDKDLHKLETISERFLKLHESVNSQNKQHANRYPKQCLIKPDDKHE